MSDENKKNDNKKNENEEYNFFKLSTEEKNDRDKGPKKKPQLS